MTTTENTPETTQLGEKFAALKATEREVTAAVIAAREAGSSWDTIGKILGISKQAAHQRYSEATRDARAARYAAADAAGNAAQWLTTPNLDTAPAETPSIFVEAPAPAKKKAAQKLPKFAKAYGDEYPKTRPVYQLPGTPPTTAQPGTGKGKHQCPSCGDTNHHGPKRGTVAMFADCTPTKYDPPATHDYMNGLTK